MKMPRLRSAAGLRLQLSLAALLCLSAGSANAYIDPNTGGLLYQILLPVIIALTAGWRYVKLTTQGLFRRLLRRPAPDADGHTPTADVRGDDAGP